MQSRSMRRSQAADIMYSEGTNQARRCAARPTMLRVTCEKSRLRGSCVGIFDFSRLVCNDERVNGKELVLVDDTTHSDCHGHLREDDNGHHLSSCGSR